MTLKAPPVVRAVPSANDSAKPVVSEVAVTVKALVVVPVNVWADVPVPDDITKF